MPTGTATPLLGLWGASESDIFIVGRSGTLLHYDGSVVAPSASPTTMDLHGVWVESSESAFAVGAAGTVLSYDGSSWDARTVGSQDLYDVHGGGAGIFAVGAAGTILVLRGGTWRSVDAPTTVTLNGVWSGDESVFVVGENGTILEGTWQ